ncbi:hypothetical protein EYF80_005644 [Liparis tanakae]|uniref:Uncharacterized protein n=1 Tax=Liparis tanakae TaxID=230148 RepID=A0A4Z2J2V1_9TELE|nr:hypothetical protein EYF80_005644 [Liparis tanakae]
MRCVEGIRAACRFVCVCACTCLLSGWDRSVSLQWQAEEPKDRPGTLPPLAAERPGGWIEPCRLGSYQYSPSRQPGRQETEPLTHSAYYSTAEHQRWVVKGHFLGHLSGVRPSLSYILQLLTPRWLFLPGLEGPERGQSGLVREREPY